MRILLFFFHNLNNLNIKYYAQNFYEKKIYFKIKFFQNKIFFYIKNKNKKYSSHL